MFGVRLEPILGNADITEWDVEYTDQFGEWWAMLSETQQEDLAARVALLEEQGPSLGRPTVDTIDRSRHPNMKELRVASSGHWRVLFAFDPRRMAILLIGGDKSATDQASPTWNDWYVEYIRRADDLYDEHVATLRREGLIP